MESPDLLLPSTLREQICAFFEPRASAVDAGEADIREGLAFVQTELLPAAGGEPNADLARVAGVIATIAWSDMSSAFSLWCQRMVLSYLAWSPAGSWLRTAGLPQVQSVTRVGSTALAAAVAHYLGGPPPPLTARVEGETLVLNGRINWASNLFLPDFVMVTAAVSVDDDRRYIVAVPGDTPGLTVNPYPRLLALQATSSSSLVLQEARLSSDWVVTDEFAPFIEAIRPTFLLLQSSFCWGLARRALTETQTCLRGVNEVLRPDLEVLTQAAAQVCTRLRDALAQPTGPAIQQIVRLRLDCAQLATATVALEAKAAGGRGYVATSPTARRLREAAFLPVQTPTEGQLRWELSRYA